MQRTIVAQVGLVYLLFSATVGCGPSTTDQAFTPSQEATQAEQPAETAHDDHPDHANQDHAATEEGGSSMAEMMAGLKELSPEDYQSAMKQHVCPVSGEMLGSMGAPKKVDVNGRNVWICCDGCRDKLLANPDEYLAKLNRS